MIRALLIFIFFLAVFTTAIFIVMQAPGFASFTYGDTTYEVPLVEFVIGLFILFTIFYILIRLFSLLFSAPRRINAAMSRRRKNKTFDTTVQGLTKYVQGDWTQAEKLLLRGTENSSCSAINYIWASRAAHKRGDFAARDDHLVAAKQAYPDKTSALEILQAELLLDQQMPEQALANLSHHSDLIRSNPKIAALFANAYEQLKDWEKLADIIPQLKSNKHLNSQIFDVVEKKALKGLLTNSDNNADEIGTKFKDLLLADQQLTVDYVAALRKQNKHVLAENVASTALNNHWCSELIRQYGLIELQDASRSLPKVEKWIDDHTDDANLYLTLGRICNKAQLWGKAKAYFESSLSRKPLPETYAELAALHEQLNEMDDAHNCAKKGLKIATRGI